jgi:peptidoglycan hydrolase-like protein with peptidoglycan-binding domain
MRPEESFVGQPIRSLQTMLRVIGEDASQPLTLIPDGFFGDQTRNAVTEFQRIFSLPQTGQVNETTWNTIADVYSVVRQGQRRLEGQYPGYELLKE